MILLDAHNHLQDARLAPHLQHILADCQQTGIGAMVVNGTCEADWPRVAELAQGHDFVIPSFGVHPWRVGECSTRWRDRLSGFLDAHPFAVGEIGLDRWVKGADLIRQEELFVAQLRIAAERDLPVTVHCLKAWGRLLELLEAGPLPPRGFLLHSYSGSADMAARFEKLGAYFSMSGYFAHARKAKQREVFRSIARDRLLLETDAPDMVPPSPSFALSNQELNHPANLGQVYGFAGELLGVAVPDLAELVTGNFQRLFGPLGCTNSS